MNSDEISWEEYDTLLESNSEKVKEILASLDSNIEAFLMQLNFLKIYCNTPHRTHVIQKRNRSGRVFWKDKNDAIVKSIRPLCSLFRMLEEIKLIPGYNEFVKGFASDEGMYTQLSFTDLIFNQPAFSVVAIEAKIGCENIDVQAVYNGAQKVHFHVKKIDQDDKFRAQFQALIQIELALDSLDIKNKDGEYLGIKDIGGVLPPNTTLEEKIQFLCRLLVKNGINPSTKKLPIEKDLSICEETLRPGYPIKLGFVWKKTKGISKEGHLNGLNHLLGFQRMGYLKDIPKNATAVEIMVGVYSPYAIFSETELLGLREDMEQSEVDGLLLLEMETPEGYPSKFLKKDVFARLNGKDCLFLEEIFLIK